MVQRRRDCFILGQFFTRSAAAIAVVTGFSWPLQARPLNPLAPAEVARQMGELTPSAYDGKALEKADGWLSDCRRSIVTVPVTDTLTGVTRSQNLVLVRPDSSGKSAPPPVMIVVPTMEGITAIEKSVASSFCEAHIATIIADVDDNSIPTEIPSWGMEDARNRYSILALRTTIDFAKTSPYFDQTRVGFMGLSLGAVMGSFIAGLESDKLAATVLVLAGGDIPYILSVSDNSRIKTIRERRMRAEGIATVADYEERMHQTVHYDPMRFADRARPANMLMVMSSNDVKVPTAMQNELYQAFGKPQNSVYSVGHVETIVALTYWYFDTVTDFLAKKFGMEILPTKPKGPAMFGTDMAPAAPHSL